MVVSPFVRKHYVSHIPMDHTAVIKFVENRFIGSSAHLTARDAAQPNLLDFFDFQSVPWATPPSPPNPVTARIARLQSVHADEHGSVAEAQNWGSSLWSNNVLDIQAADLVFLPPGRGADLPDQAFVGVPFNAIGVDLVLERLRGQHNGFVQEPLVTTDVKLQLSLAIAPAGDCIGVMHEGTSTGIVETLYCLEQSLRLMQLVVYRPFCCLRSAIIFNSLREQCDMTRPTFGCGSRFCGSAMFHQGKYQTADAVPGNLDTNTEQQEGDDPHDSIGSLGRDLPRDQRCIRVSEIHQYTKHDDGDENAEVSEEIRNEPVC